MSSIYDNNDNNNANNANPTGSLSTVGNVTSTSNAPAKAKPQGSGRFTNIQKYIEANKNAGSDMAGKVGSQVQSGINKENKEAGDYYKNLGSAISGANKVAKEGAAYNKTLQEIGQNIEGAGYKEGDSLDRNNTYTNDDPSTLQNKIEIGNGIRTYTPGDPDKIVPRKEIGDSIREGNLGIEDFMNDPNYSKYAAFQAGRGINEQALSAQQGRASQEAGEYVDAAKAAQDALGSEQGRFDLLRKRFGGEGRSGYSTGQQRLDQALMSSGGGLSDLRGSVSDSVRASQALNKNIMGQGAAVKDIARLESDIIGNINKQNLTNEDLYKQMMGTYVDPTNAARHAEQAALEGGFNVDTGKTISLDQQGLTKEQYDMLGVSGPTKDYGTLEGLKDVWEVANRGRDAEGYGDIANLSDVNKYAMLSKLSGSGNTISESNLEDATFGKEGDASLMGRIGSAEGAFNEKARDTVLNKRISSRTGLGSASGSVEDILREGEAGLDTESKYMYGESRKKRAVQDVMDQYKQFLRDQKYGSSIG